MRVATLPTRLWPSWTAPLYLDRGPNVEAVADAFAAALDADGRTPELRPNIVGVGHEREKTVLALASLRSQLLVSGTPIDYERRRILPWQRFLPDSDWRRLGESIDINPGSEEQANLARRYMYMRLTGDGPQRLPAELGRQHQDNDAQDTTFLLHFTLELQSAMDGYARDFFGEEECEMLWEHPYSPTRLITEPLVWSPERSVLARTRAVARELDDIDTAKMHTLLAEGNATLSWLSTELHRTVAHVKLALNAWPLSSG
ncbi:hypothetical protein [Curtobacterium sp. PhB115]|uniref:hypothetical protein n=1 Tax=Curtobacterium sp. PhB115 TaxID=2485173 RepID=UPI0021A6E442|nr:hypothetical protein [Curtobacterium sp. PhB115]